MNNLERLEKMTNNLPPIIELEDLVCFSNEGYVEFSVEGGRCFALTLLDKESVLVIRLFISKDAVFPTRNNESNEIITVFRGEFEIRLGKEKPQTLKIGDSVCLPPNIPRGGKAIEDTWMIVTSVPRTKSYPRN